MVDSSIIHVLQFRVSIHMCPNEGQITSVTVAYEKGGQGGQLPPHFYTNDTTVHTI